MNGGWHVKLTSANSSPVTVTLTGNVNLPVTCASGGGSGGTITVPVSKTVTIPAGSTSYVPTNDTKSVLGWMGAVQAPALCGANAMSNTSATLNATVQSSSHTGQLSFQFHYRVPVAKRQAEHELHRLGQRHDVPGEVELDRHALAIA